jgi:hypothetical protein
MNAIKNSTRKEKAENKVDGVALFESEWERESF